MSDSEIFDRNLRRARRDRAVRLSSGESGVLRFVVKDLLDRIDAENRTYLSACVFNGAATTLISGLRARGIHVEVCDPGSYFAGDGFQTDEDMWSSVPESFDLIVSVGLIDSVNDVPGALLLMRRALKPGGVMFASFAGAGSLETLRTILRSIEPSLQRTHPQIDVRAGGDLLTRAGFKGAVADVETLKRLFPDLQALISAMRQHAATNLLKARHPLHRAIYQRLVTDAAFANPFTETLSIITLTGWV